MNTITKTPVILVIDDHEALRQSLITLLDAHGYDAVGCIDGEDALAQLRGGLRPCLILLDLRMPRTGGLQFREEQARDALLASIPTVIISAEAADFRQQLAGVVAALPKPIPVDALLEIVARHCC